ncbi:Phage portal protein, SPP1 Gp6-like [compost metagenome]
MYTFERKVQTLTENSLASAMLSAKGLQISEEQRARLDKIQSDWQFYEGYHWQGISDTDKPQVTKNYIRKFVDKFVAFEFRKGFILNMKPEIEQITENNPKEFISNVWDDNGKFAKLTEIGISKSITGDAWIQPYFEPKYINGKRNPDFDDPYDLYEKGRIRIFVLHPSICFPEYEEGTDKDKLVKFTIMYPIKVNDSLLGMNRFRETIRKIVWTKDRVQEFVGDKKISDLPNKYGTLTFVQMRNLPMTGSSYGQNDIDDIIPLNVELNLKTSDISEIIDYHSAPITLVFGARLGNLDRGANKVWGGLPKDAKVENLKLEGNLEAAASYLTDLKTAMHEIGGIPVGALGGELKISNTSGIALEIAMLPLLERIDIKQNCSAEALQKINSLILLIGEKEGMIKVPPGIKRADFFYNEVSFEDALPKDAVRELQQIESEMVLGLEDREGAMERLGRENIPTKIARIDADRKANPEVYGTKTPGKNAEGGRKKLNAGDLNSPEPQE